MLFFESLCGLWRSFLPDNARCCPDFSRFLPSFLRILPQKIRKQSEKSLFLLLFAVFSRSFSDIWGRFFFFWGRFRLWVVFLLLLRCDFFCRFCDFCDFCSALLGFFAPMDCFFATAILIKTEESGDFTLNNDELWFFRFFSFLLGLFLHKLLRFLQKTCVKNTNSEFSRLRFTDIFAYTVMFLCNYLIFCMKFVTVTKSKPARCFP